MEDMGLVARLPRAGEDLLDEPRRVPLSARAPDYADYFHTEYGNGVG
jgi:hypothetical protein